jgi:hypothetical protein
MLVHVLFHLEKRVFTTKTIMTSIKMMIMLSTCQHQVFCIFFYPVSQDLNHRQQFYPSTYARLYCCRAGIAGPKSNKRVLL